MSTTTTTSALAFSSVLPIIEPRPKPRNIGLTEVRSAAMSQEQLLDWVEFLGPYLDSIKWTVATQRLIPRETVREINAAMRARNIGVSSGGLIESVMPHGDAAVARFLEEAREIGYTIVEISTSSIAISLEEKCALVRAVLAAGLKPKPEINANPPGDRVFTSTDKVIRESNALLEAGAWKLMIEETAIFDGTDPELWDRDFAHGLASAISLEHIYWEASSVQLSEWLLREFGPDVNMFGDFGNLAYIAALRAGIFGPLAERAGGQSRPVAVPW